MGYWTFTCTVVPWCCCSMESILYLSMSNQYPAVSQIPIHAQDLSDCKLVCSLISPLSWRVIELCNETFKTGWINFQQFISETSESSSCCLSDFSFLLDLSRQIMILKSVTFYKFSTLYKITITMLGGKYFLYLKQYHFWTLLGTWSSAGYFSSDLLFPFLLLKCKI